MKKHLVTALLLLLCAGMGYSWTSESANYTSPNYPSAYPNNYNNTITITKPGATRIRVHFSAFDTESGYDFVYIQNGSGTQVASYNGSKGAFTSAEVTGDTLKVKFTSDGSVTRTGWKIDYIEYETSTTTTTTTTVASSWVSDSASYSSPNYPSAYPNNYNNTITITKTGATSIRVHFSAFATESGYDYVYILDGAGNQITSYSGSKGAFTSVTVTGSTIKVKFTSDGSVTAAGWYIDRVEYLGGSSTTTTTTPVTTTTTTTTTTTVAPVTTTTTTVASTWNTETASYTSPNYPSNYDNNYNNTITITKTGATSIRVHFSAFNTESGYDFVYIQDSAGNNITSYSGNRGAFTSVEVTGSTLKVKFTSDYSVTATGWKIDRIEYLGGTVTTTSTTTTTTTIAGPSARSGMGAIPYTGGVTFRVWAPNATSVGVSGTFNSWGVRSLASEGNGYWSTDVAGASAGQMYKFVINGASYKKDPYARKQEHSAGASIVYQTGSVPAGITIPWFEDMIIYQLHVGSYGGSSSTGVGDFGDVVAKAQYIKDLGVNMVELLPVMEFPGDNSWGYNPSDPFAVESTYGGPEALKNLVAALHGKGIGLILDIVYNHFGPSDLDLWQFDGWSENGAGGIYFYNDWRNHTDWGDTRPDYGRGEVRQYLRDNAIYWLQEFNVDGLRWDSTINIRKVNYSTDLPDGWSLMQYINNEINSIKPSAISIAEDLQQEPWITYTTGAGGAGFDAQWDAAFVHPVKTAIETAWDSDRDMNSVAGAVGIHYGDRTRQVIYVSSHDEVGNGKQRPPSAIDSSNPGSWFAKKRTTLGTGVLMTAPGIPMIFQGEEFLQPGWFDMNVANNYLNWNLTTTYSGILQMYKDLIRIRKNYAALRSNNITVFHIDDSNKLIAYHRWDGSQNMVVIANFGSTSWSGNYQIGWPVWATGHSVFNSDWNGYSADFGNHGGWDISPVSGGMDGMNQRANISIAPYSVVIYDLY